jgi:hypothetical protein
MIHRLCQHRWPAIAGMVGFRNVVGSAPLEGWVSPSSQRIAFSRGTYLRAPFSRKDSRAGHTGYQGFVAINNQDSPWSATFWTGMPNGSYCNVIDSVAYFGACSRTSCVKDAPHCHSQPMFIVFVGSRSSSSVCCRSPSVPARRSRCT